MPSVSQCIKSHDITFWPLPILENSRKISKKSDADHESRRRLAAMNGSTGVGSLIIFEGRRTAILGRRPLVPGLVSMRDGSVRDSELMGSLALVGVRASSLVRFFEKTSGFGSGFGGGAGYSYRGGKRSCIIEGGATRTLEARWESL